MQKKKRKKAVLPAKLQRILQFKDFKKRLLQMAKACDAVAAFKLIPKRELENLFVHRFKSFEIVAQDGYDMKPEVYKLLKELVYGHLKLMRFSFVDGGSEINLYDYYSVGEYLRIVLSDYRRRGVKGADQIVDAFKPLLDNYDDPNSAGIMLFHVGLVLSCEISRYDVGFWTFEQNHVVTTSPSYESYFCFKVNCIPRQVRHLNIDGNTRPVFRVGWTCLGGKFTWVMVTPQQLNIDSAFKGLQIEVYVQSHALRRLEERLDTMSLDVISHLLFENVKMWVAVKNKKGQSLLAFYANGVKLGYLLYVYIDGVVLIKTFLLLTNNGTPEGGKLFDILHLQINDRQYLHLDRLSHFLKSDIPDNATLYADFKKAGCEGLFEVEEGLMCKRLDANVHAALIEKYIHSE